jgi:flagellar basal body-associated protein FliL
MNASRQRLPSRKRFYWLGLLPVFLGGGCGGGESAPLMDAAALLARYEHGRQAYDPRKLTEVDLGQFTVTQRREPAIFFIRFQLFAIVSDDQVENFARLVETHGERLRSEVREIVQGSDLEQLNDPALVWLKAELVQAINRRVGTTIVHDVVFAEFTFERG